MSIFSREKAASEPFKTTSAPLDRRTLLARFFALSRYAAGTMGLFHLAGFISPNAIAANRDGNKTPEDAPIDVLVVGSGFAGLAAAISAREAGAKRVVIIEKLPMAGGHGLVSSGSFAAALPVDFEAEQKTERRISGISRSMLNKKASDAAIESFYRDLLAAGGDTICPALARKLARESWNAVRWLADLGVRWSPRVFQAVGSPARRNLSTGSPQAGLDYIVTLLARARSLGIEIRFETTATALKEEAVRSDDGKVENRLTGVRIIQPSTLKMSANKSQSNIEGSESTVSRSDTVLCARAVVLATGGFGANLEMRKRFAPDVPERFSTTANPTGAMLDGATGDGIRIAQAAGAALIGMSDIQIMPYSGGRLLDYVGGEIWLNAQGKRFARPGLLFRELKRAILAQPDGIMWALSDSATPKGATLGAKLDQGIVRRADSLEEAAVGMNMSFPVLRETIDRWNRAVDRGWDDEFDAPLMGSRIETPPFYYGLERFSVHYTCGGIAINCDAAVLDRAGNVIPGLFAAGETTGGVHGRDRIGGASVTDCIVFGRTAGASAARFAKRLATEAS